MMFKQQSALHHADFGMIIWYGSGIMQIAMLTVICSPCNAYFTLGVLMQEPTAAAKDKSMQALVVSRETIPGAQEINRYRTEHGFPQLRIVVIELIADTQAVEGGKVSSTALRQQDAATSRSRSDVQAD